MPVYFMLIFLGKAMPLTLVYFKRPYRSAEGGTESPWDRWRFRGQNPEPLENIPRP